MMPSHPADIHIAISFDDGYVAFVYTLLNSLFKNNKESSVTIHAIAPAVQAVDKQTLQAFVEKQGGKLHFYELNPAVITKEFVLPDPEVSGLTIAAYYRIFFAHLVPSNIAKLLYIDIDTIVVGSFADLFQTDLEGFAVGAIKDIDMHVRTDLDIPNPDDYFNSGVMLIDLPQWRAQRITERACDVIATQFAKIKQWADQDVLNMVFNGQWYRLDWRYNVMKGYIPEDLPKQQYARFLSDKVLIHYSGHLKPWHRACDSKFRYLYPLYFTPSTRSTASGYVSKKMTVSSLLQLTRSRALEVYFDNPAIGKVWRQLKSALRK